MGLKTLGEKVQQLYYVVSLETAVLYLLGLRVSSTAEKKKEAATSDRFTTMVLKTELCRLVVPRYTLERASDLFAQTRRFSSLLTQNARGISNNRLRPAKLTWTAMYRKQHKKDIAAEAVKKRRKHQEAILKVPLWKLFRREELRSPKSVTLHVKLPYVSYLSEIKERIKKTKDEKKAKKAETMSKQKTSKGSQPKGAMPKGPKIGGGGGKR
ncbi:UNVERIFIED_CONTAM: 60S ribosomal protein L24-2 [Sesamum angustifolium]|uniref:60S ribosomal protein L24-2 n=1 Tax=Sesamum angustifolium TaxID=2727405 RepID=A0AAW2MIH3_9LAMI